MQVASSYANLAGLLRGQYRYGEAQAFTRKALEIRMHTLPPTHPDLAAAHISLAHLLHELGQYVDLGQALGLSSALGLFRSWLSNSTCSSACAAVSTTPKAWCSVSTWGWCWELGAESRVQKAGVWDEGVQRLHGTVSCRGRAEGMFRV